jgi:hypothetical protein
MATENGVVKQPINLAQAWKRKTETVEFPSGASAVMTRPDALSLLAESNDIPDTFFKAIQESQSTGKAPTENLSPAEMREFFKTMTFFAEQLAVKHFVSPVIVFDHEPDYEANEISIEDVKAMDMLDKQFLMGWSMFGGSAVDALSRFRQQQATVVASTSNR